MSVQNISDITVTSLECINAFDVVTGNYLFTLDELQNTTIAQTEDKSEITGKHGRKISSLKRNKAVTISGANGMVSGGLLEMQTGGSFEHKVTEVMWTDYLTVGADNKTHTNYTAVGTTGAEIEALYTKNPNGTLGKLLEQDADTTTEGKFKYSPENKELQFHTDIAVGTEIIVYYKRQITADVLVNDTQTFSKKCSLYVDAFGEDKCANLFRIQFFIPKADFNGEFSIEMGENQTVHEFEAESLAGACGEGVSGLLWTYTIFGADTNDTTVGKVALSIADKDTTLKDSHKANELITDNCNIEWDGIHGSVTGGIKHVNNGSEYSDNSSGNYIFPLMLHESYSGKEITVKRTSGSGDEKTAVTRIWILDLPDGKDTKYEIYYDRALIATLSFDAATFNET